MTAAAFDKVPTLKLLIVPIGTRTSALLVDNSTANQSPSTASFTLYATVPTAPHSPSSSCVDSKKKKKKEREKIYFFSYCKFLPFVWPQDLLYYASQWHKELNGTDGKPTRALLEHDHYCKAVQHWHMDEYCVGMDLFQSHPKVQQGHLNSVCSRWRKYRCKCRCCINTCSAEHCGL